MLSQIADILENEAQCAICRACVCNPVTYVIPSVAFAHQFWQWNSLGSCGHTFCALCIERHFRGHLSKKLARFSLDNLIRDIIPLPKTLVQRQNVSRVISSHGGDTSAIFSYQCPNCRKVVKEAPVVAYQLRSLLSEARPLLLASLPDDDIPPTDFPLTLFDSLFE